MMDAGRRRSPLAVYVVWHPRCADGPVLARTLYDWLTASTDDLRWSGHGIPVRYATSTSGPPAALDIDVADRLVAVHLIDEHWVADRKWRDYLDAAFVEGHGEASRTYTFEAPAIKDRVLALPAMLHRSAMNLRALRTPMVIDPPTEPSDRLSERKERLRRRVTQAMGRWFLASSTTQRELTAHETDPEVGARPTVFISHAKADGAALGKELREEVINYGQLRPFFDENDLPYGADWRLRLTNATENVNSMIAILTDAYAGRAWCRTELLAARRPQRHGVEHIWTIRPVAAIERLEKQFTTFLPELGNIPVVRWQPGIAATVLDRIVLQMLLTEYHARIARGLVQHAPSPAATPTPRSDLARHFVTWVPDVTTTAHLLGEAKAKHREPVEVVYPGYGLRLSERQKLEAIFAAYPVSLRTYDEIAAELDGAHYQHPAQLTHRERRPPVAVSASYPPVDDLHRRGLGEEHFHEFVVRLGRALLDADHPLAYGGFPPGAQARPGGPTAAPGGLSALPGAAADRAVPRPSAARENFTWTLSELARAERLLDAAVDGLPESGYRPLFYSYLAPASPVDLTDEHVADDHGLCAYVRLARPSPRPIDDPQGAWANSAALSLLRRAMASSDERDVDGEPVPRCRARVLVGGAVADFGGVIPGLAEEVLYTLEAGIPVYVVGGFGGAAEAIAATLETGTLTPPLELATMRSSAKVAETHRAYATVGYAPSPEEVHERLRLALTSPLPPNGLTDKENRRLHESTDAVEIISLIERGLAVLSAGPPRG